MIRRLIDILIFIILIVIPLLFWWTYTGPFQWIAEAQLSMMGSYEESITVVLTLVVWLGFLALLAWFARKFLGLPIDLKSLNTRPDQFANRVIGAGFIVAPIVLLALAGYLRTLTTTPASHISINELAAGKPYPTRYLTIDDAATVPDLDYSITEGSGAKTTTHYFPLLPANYQEGQPVHAFLEVADDNVAAVSDPKAVYSGLVAFGNLPGMARVAFERDKLPPAPGYILLRLGKSPGGYASSASGCLVAAGVTALIGVIIVVRDFIFAKRSARREATPRI